ncbi:MAG: hypothetical protein ACPLZY_03770 [Candidatus Norongarragalinales archaeon]
MKSCTESNMMLKTGVLARELCLLIRHNRAVLEPKNLQKICLHISGLCEEVECNVPSYLAAGQPKPSVPTDEGKYLELCTKSIMETLDATDQHT